MKARLRVVADGWAEVSAHLFQGDGREHAAFLPAVFERTPDGVEVLTQSPILIPDKDLVGGADVQHLEVSPEALIRVVNEAVRRECGLIELHNHSPDFPARFSKWDQRGFRDVVPYMKSSLPGANYGALVLGSPDNVDGIIWTDNCEVPLADIEVVGRSRTALVTTNSKDAGLPSVEMTDDDLAVFDRQVRAFGQEGQHALAQLRIGIVGLGGIGSIVLEELVRSGVRNLVLIDFDVAECSNLTRVAMLLPQDVAAKRKKVEALADRVRVLAPDVELHVIGKSIYSPEALTALAQTDILVGCTDDSATRFALNELSLRTLRPYLDVASEISTESNQLAAYGGRYTFTVPGQGCLLCAQAIDLREATAEFQPLAAREVNQRAGYIEGSVERAPSVMSLNGVVASLAILELQAWATGLRPCHPQVLFDGESGEAQRVLFRRSPSCICCNEFLGIGAVATAVRRYENLVG